MVSVISRYDIQGVVKKFLSQLVYPKLWSEQDFFLFTEQQENIKVFSNLKNIYIDSQNDNSCLGRWSSILYSCHSVVQKEMRESRKWFKAGQTSTAQNVETYAEV